MADDTERKFDAAVATRAMAALSAAFPLRSPLLPPPMRSFIWWSDAPAPWTAAAAAEAEAAAAAAAAADDDAAEPLVDAATLRERERVLAWLAALALPMPHNSGTERDLTPLSRIRTVEDVPAAFASGALLCVVVERLLGERISGVRAGATAFAARCANFDAALSRLHSSPQPRGASRWSAKVLAAGERSAAMRAGLWSLLSALFERFARPGAGWLAVGGAARADADAARRLADAAAGAPPPPLRPPLSAGSPTRGSGGGAALLLGWVAPAGADAASSVPTPSSDSSGGWRAPSGGANEEHAAAHEWLRRSFGFDIDEVAVTLGDAAHPLDDALCNGILLGRVAAALAQRAGVSSSPPPHARPRLPSHARANLTAALRLLRRAGVGAAPLNAAERALPAIILGERRPLWALLDALRCHGPPPPPTAAASAAAEVEAEVLRWLLGAGLLRHEIAHEIAGSLGTDLPALALPTLERVMPFVCTGELLCDVAAHVSQQRVCGVFRPPRTRATALANVRKATARLQPLLAAARLLRSTSEWSDERLLRGDRHAALAWLCAARSCVARSSAAEPPPDALDVDVLPPHGHLAAAAAAAAYEEYEEPPLSPPPPVSSPPPNLPPPPQPPSPPHSAAALEPQVDPADLARLSQWLRSLGLAAAAAELDRPTLGEWCDGLRLCELVEALERRELPGVTRAPKSSASARHNVEKACEALRRKQGMALDHAFSTTSILRGDQPTIVALLRDARRAYRARTALRSIR